MAGMHPSLVRGAWLRFGSRRIRWRALALLASCTLLLMLSLPGGAARAASREARCAVELNGNPVAQGTATLPIDDSVTLSGAARGTGATHVSLEFFGKRWTLPDVTTSGGQWSKQIDVADYARWGVGLYRIVWDGPAATGECSATVKIEGSLFGSWATRASMISFALGAGALLLMLRQTFTFNRRGKWNLELSAGVRGEKDKASGRPRLRLRFSIGQTLLVTLACLLLSGATIATLVQTAMSPPTVTVAVWVTIPLTVAILLLRSLVGKHARASGARPARRTPVEAL